MSKDPIEMLDNEINEQWLYLALTIVAHLRAMVSMAQSHRIILIFRFFSCTVLAAIASLSLLNPYLLFDCFFLPFLALVIIFHVGEYVTRHMIYVMPDHMGLQKILRSLERRKKKLQTNEAFLLRNLCTAIILNEETVIRILVTQISPSNSLSKWRLIKHVKRLYPLHR